MSERTYTQQEYEEGRIQAVSQAIGMVKRMRDKQKGNKGNKRKGKKLPEEAEVDNLISVVEKRSNRIKESKRQDNKAK